MATCKNNGVGVSIVNLDKFKFLQVVGATRRESVEQFDVN